MKKTKNIVFGLFLLGNLFITTNIYSQVYGGEGSKWYGGGSLGINIGSITAISIMPEAAYAVTDYFHIGAGIGYSYYQDNRVVPVRKLNEWGGKLYGRLFFMDFFVHAEYAPVYQNDSYYSSLSGNDWVYWDYLYGGVGYRSWIGGNSFMSVVLLFDLKNLDNINFGYNPFIRFGFGVGF